MICRRVPVTGSALLALVVVLLAAGCSGSEPKTYPVKGKVVFKDNPGFVGRLLGGSVEFQSTSDPNLKVTGLIDDEGSFSMITVLEDKALNGAPAGQYKARVQPPKD